MLVTKTSKLTGAVHTREVPVTEAQLAAWKQSGAFVQDALPHLSADDREFLISGSTPEEWDAVFGEDA